MPLLLPPPPPLQQTPANTTTIIPCIILLPKKKKKKWTNTHRAIQCEGSPTITMSLQHLTHSRLWPRRRTRFPIAQRRNRLRIIFLIRLVLLWMATTMQMQNVCPLLHHGETPWPCLLPVLLLVLVSHHPHLLFPMTTHHRHRHRLPP